jgi:hypothetical protein
MIDHMLRLGSASLEGGLFPLALAVSSSGRVSFTIRQVMIMTMNLDAALMKNTAWRLTSPATMPPRRGPIIWPSRSVVLRVATARPRFSGVLMSATMTCDVVCHIETPMAAPVTAIGLRPQWSAKYPVRGPETMRESASVEMRTVTRNTESVIA